MIESLTPGDKEEEKKIIDQFIKRIKERKMHEWCQSLKEAILKSFNEIKKMNLDNEKTRSNNRERKEYIYNVRINLAVVKYAAQIKDQIAKHIEDVKIEEINTQCK